MKTYSPFLYVTLATYFLITSCNQTKTIEQQMDSQHTICYIAISANDTAWLKIDTSSKQIKGLLTFSYANKKKFEGQFKGTINGDTLKGHYDFKVNKVDKWYRNPVAFLKKEGKLTMGVGEISMVWGSAFFDDKVPINYDKGRFVFDKVGECNP
ncbi:hypothetical protein GM921_02350 [Pedobacter sp. LMG 31464]|uniref:Uncharacterized protein n=1 Tax=Pedobacter planticolens TaxID=2679964 RepID=A0A923IUM3_9SPHI|nr:hypothetical protein [Pedobacter planticolens]MBB2144314.1 hypothetical protein [Pedobacter planticolens]